MNIDMDRLIELRKFCGSIYPNSYYINGCIYDKNHKMLIHLSFDYRYSELEKELWTYTSFKRHIENEILRKLES